MYFCCRLKEESVELPGNDEAPQIDPQQQVASAPNFRSEAPAIGFQPFVVGSTYQTFENDVEPPYERVERKYFKDIKDRISKIGVKYFFSLRKYLSLIYQINNHII